MTDRELLELAAKAAGYDVRWHDRWECFVHVAPYNIDNPPTLAGQRMVWTPLTDDGDALRLAVKLQLTICNEQVLAGGAYCTRGDDESFPGANGAVNGGSEVMPDDYSATRRAIVLAAAEIGKAKP